MVLKTNPHQESILQEKVTEVMNDPGYSDADKIEMESVLEQLEQN